MAEDQGAEAVGNLIPAHDLEERLLNYDTFCGCGIGLNPSHTDRVIKDLRAQLERDSTESKTGDLYFTLLPGRSYYSEMGLDSVAFFCNTGSGSIRIAIDEYKKFISVIDKKCGGYIAGSVGQKGSWSVGYMRSRQNFCKNALSSSASHC
ncbi:hypothetical protein LIA77_10471 [Sarocladium implicatum]|nr:hypothetical protein LIA77_10471 [Sarocladium implicatum]